MKITVVDNISSIDGQAWNRLILDNNPFLKHQFLLALEKHNCVGKQCGWQPQHIVIHDHDNRLIAASPLYIKYHSHGEFVFDWAWAEAYQRNHMAYYPKLVAAIPYTPMTGQRLLIAPEVNSAETGKLLIEATIKLAREYKLSSVHWLFPTKEQKDLLQQQNLSIRLGCQYHWHNQDYESFEHYLSHFSSRKRKNILKERCQVQQLGLEFKVLHGNEISHEEWQLFHQYYRDIYDRKRGFASLTLGFFEEIGKTMAEQVVLVQAYRGNKCIASALNLRSDDTLYGRHWGCSESLPGLHFEACYYQGLEYCIQHGLKRFEPGAQGEHKIARGFLPSETWSAHWIADPKFRGAVDHFTHNEMAEMKSLIQKLDRNSPFHKKN